MASFILRRLGVMILTALCLTFIVFFLTNLYPNLEKLAKTQGNQRMSDEAVTSYLTKNGYLEPLWARYGAWLWNFVTGDFGQSIRFKVPVADVLWPRLWNTAVLGFWTFAILIPLSLTLGVLAFVVILAFSMVNLYATSRLGARR